MTITIENPTAESFYAAILQLPSEEKSKLATLLQSEKVDVSSEWSDEDLRDLDRDTARLIDARFGPEEGLYD